MTTQGYNFKGLLDYDPNLAYNTKLYGGQGGKGLSQNQQSYFGGQFNDNFSRYLGTQGQGLLDAQGKGLTLDQYLQNPQSQFSDYLDQNPFQQQWGQMAPSQRPGGSTQRYAPNTRWIQ